MLSNDADVAFWRTMSVIPGRCLSVLFLGDTPKGHNLNGEGSMEFVPS